MMSANIWCTILYLQVAYPKKIGLKYHFPVALRPNSGYDLLIIEVSISTYNDALQSVGLLWTRDHFVAETST